MLPLLLLCHAALTIAAPTRQCDLNKAAIKGGDHYLSEDENTVQYNCSTGMYPYPGPIRECTRRGTWTNEKEKAECRPIECPKPQTFEGGEYFPVAKNYYIGAILTFECWGGYKMVGPESRTCQANGKWSGRTTICDDNQGYCPNPGIPIGATKAGTSYRIEDRVRYQCQDGSMFGSSERECQEDKTWSGREPSCRKWYAYDTPEEVKEDFASSLAETIESSNPNRVEEKTDRKLSITAGGLMNIFIIIDASKSVGKKNFNTAKDIAATFIEKVSTYAFTPRYCIITYASEAKTLVSIVDERNTEAEDVIDSIKAFKYEAHDDKQGTNTRGALRAVYGELSLFKLRNEKTFLETSNIILLMTDGKHNMGGDPSVEVRSIKDFLDIRKDNSRDDKLDIYVFGVGNEVSTDELNDIASKKDNEKHVFKMESIDTMKKSFEAIIDETHAFAMCGISNSHPEDNDEKKKFPWIVKISVTRPEGVENCKGSIITQNFILTAAHCFHLHESTHAVAVQTGEKGSLKIKNIYRHPKYDPNAKQDKNIKSYDYDLAILELEKKLEFQATVRPICLPCTSGAAWALKLRDKKSTCKEHENILLPKTAETVPSLFITEETVDSEVRYVEKFVDIKQGNARNGCLDDARKVEKFKDLADIKDVAADSFLCTGGVHPKIEPQTCKGDSGGPLMIQHKNRHVQVGVISWGTINSCKQLKRDRVPEASRDFHASVLYGLDWILDIAKEELLPTEE
ncbi:complement factor B-like [Hyperolius riggenbachi]|uniref:complement factor B-like n=1 Tax=Hyperolius riggenbachi TaxID=752182 RepID=UPI0035A31494